MAAAVVVVAVTVTVYGGDFDLLLGVVVVW